MAGGGVLTSLAIFVVSTAVSIAISALTAPNIKGPRSKDSGVQSSDYGRGIPLVYGPNNRLAGQVIYYSGLFENKRKKSGSGGSTTTYTYSCTFAVALCEAKPGATITRVWANKKLIYDEGEFSVMESITFYDGDSTQEPDPVLELNIGVGSVPAYRGVCYFVVKDLQLADFGPTMPQIEVELVADASMTVDGVVLDIADKAGVVIDTSLLEGNVGQLDGYVIANNVSVADALAPLAAAYYFDVAERGGELVCVPRGMGSVATIDMADAGAVALTATPSKTINNERAPEAELPKEVAVTYRDMFRDYQPSTERAERTLGSAKENVELDIPLTLDSNQARRIAHRVLWGIICSRRTAKLSVSPRWIGVLPADVINMEVPTGAYLPYRITKSTLGADGVLQWEVQYEDADLYNCSTVDGAETTTDPDGGEGGNADEAVGATILILMDTSILRDDHDNAGFYWVGTGTTDAWRGYTVYRSTDGGTDYETISDAVTGGTVGTVATATPSGNVDGWDRASTIRVTLYDSNNELETRSELSVLNGRNTAWIGPASGVGGEIVQFATATLVSTGVYDLTDLLRGRRGTEWTVASHGASEYFVLLDDSGSLYRRDMGAADLDLERLYKPVSVLTLVDDATAQEFTNGGEGLRPWQPAHLVGRRNSDQDLSVSWHRRTRLFTAGLGGTAPLGEQEETYEIDFYVPADEWTLGASYSIGDTRRLQSAHDYGWRYYRATVAHTGTLLNKPNQTSANWASRWIEVPPARTVHLGNNSNYTYTAAAQVTDGQTPGAQFEVQCRQFSAIRGFGHPALVVA